MLRETDRHFKFDWLTIILFFLLVGFGWVNILSASHSGDAIELFNFSHSYSKQLIFIGLSVVLIIFILSLEAKFYERFSSIFYLISIQYQKFNILYSFIFSSFLFPSRTVAKTLDFEGN